MIYRQLELGDLEQVCGVIAGIRNQYGRLHGVLHLAGQMRDNLLVHKPAAEIAGVLEPKVQGTWHLDQALGGEELDFFVMFSSVSGVVGNPRSADYAAANAFMDRYAEYRNGLVAKGERRGRTRSICWPLWQAGGMELEQDALDRLEQATGMRPMRTEVGLEAFYRSLALPYEQILVVAGELSRIRAFYLTPEAAEPANGTVLVAKGEEPALATHGAVSLEELEKQLQAILASVLKVKPSLIAEDQAFVELGLDSFLGTELVQAINRRYGTALSNITVFDYPTIRDLALLLSKTVVSLPVSEQPAAVRTQPVRTAPIAASEPASVSDDRIAIIGMSGRYPQAGNLNQYWSNLEAGRNSIQEVPASRWSVERYYDATGVVEGKTNSRWMGVLEDMECFDPLFFRISPQEADLIDPHHRLFLEESYKAFEDAGYAGGSLGNRRCGVYLGISGNEYAQLLSRRGVVSAPVTSNHTAIAAARIAYYLNLKGPALSVDTACSSSLVAIHLACQSLLRGETEMALAGGVTLWLSAEPYVSMSQAGMLSPVGQCKAFDNSADGIVVSEGVGAVVLKRLKDAEADGDCIYGVILGSGVNQDGRTNGITAPSVQSQIELERSVYARHGIDPATISYVETHGTGTRLGDPIELEALATVFAENCSEQNWCALGSVKSNIGHTVSSAGVASVHKVLLSLKHRTLVPSLHVSQENTQFDFEHSPFYISRQTKSWEVPAGMPRRAAVSSFGFQRDQCAPGAGGVCRPVAPQPWS